MNLAKRIVCLCRAVQQCRIQCICADGRLILPAEVRARLGELLLAVVVVRDTRLQHR